MFSVGAFENALTVANCARLAMIQNRTAATIMASANADEALAALFPLRVPPAPVPYGAILPGQAPLGGG